MSNGKNGRSQSRNGRKPARKTPEIRPAVAKSTKKEMEDRIQFAMQLLVEGHQTWQIIRRFKEKYAGRNGKQIASRTISGYLARARERLLRSVDIPREEMCSQLAAILHKSITDPGASIRDRQRGVKMLADLFGLKSPLKIARTDSAGNDLYREALKDLSVDELKVLARAQDRMDELVRGGAGSMNGAAVGRRSGSR